MENSLRGQAIPSRSFGTLSQRQVPPTETRKTETVDHRTRLLQRVSALLVDVSSDVLTSAVDSVVDVFFSDEFSTEAERQTMVQGLLSCDSGEFLELQEIVQKLNKPSEKEVVTLRGEPGSSRSPSPSPKSSPVPSIDPTHISAQWLQDQIQPIPIVNVLEVLTKDADYWASQLSQILGPTQTQIVRHLTENRFVVYWVTRLLNEENKTSIQAELSMTQEGRELVKALGIPIQAGLTYIDYKRLVFSAGGNLMTNQTVNLPQEARRKSDETKEVIWIPFPQAQKTDSAGLNLGELPEEIHKALGSITSVNPLQAKVYPSVYQTDENLLVCAPTGSGKTLLALLAILRNLNGLSIFVAPMRALVQETAGNLRHRLQDYNVTVTELTGESKQGKKRLANSEVIVTTPEKLDVLSRKLGRHNWLQDLSLLIIDEIHLLHDTRGGVLESLVSRFRHIRIVALSATLENWRDVASWLRVPESHTWYFDSSFRPVPLALEFVGMRATHPLTRQHDLDKECCQSVSKHLEDGQVMVFVHSRKQAFKTAQMLQDFARKPTATSHAILVHVSEQIKNLELASLLPSGIAAHHAGLTSVDRRAVEDLFANRHLNVLVSTATLAWGVNLPAHTVIIKGTTVYSSEQGRWTQLSHQDLLQMIGRAGRPGFDQTGWGVVLTQHSLLPYYLSTLNAQLPVESQLMRRINEAVNAEIVMGRVGSLMDAVGWFEDTYWFTRMLANPAVYGGKDFSQPQFRTNLMHSVLLTLSKSGLLTYDVQSGKVEWTSAGTIASDFYLPLKTIQTFSETLHEFMEEIELLRLLSQADEFAQLTVRPEEVQEISSLLTQVPIPVLGAADDGSTKVAVLFQAWVSRRPLSGYAIRQDMSHVAESAGRLLGAVFALAVDRGWGKPALAALRLVQVAQRRTWAAQTPLRHFSDLLTVQTLKKLESRDIGQAHLIAATLEQVTELVGDQEAKKVFQLVKNLPIPDLKVELWPLTAGSFLLKVWISSSSFQWNEKYHGSSIWSHFFLLDGSAHMILHEEMVRIRPAMTTQLQVWIGRLSPMPVVMFAQLVVESWVGMEIKLPIDLRGLRFPTQVYQPLIPSLETWEVSQILEWPEALKVLGIDSLRGWQVDWKSVLSMQKSVVIAAPAGTGKTLFGLLAALYHIATHESEVVFLAARMPTLPKLRKLVCADPTHVDTASAGLLIIDDLDDLTSELESAVTNIRITNPELRVVGLSMCCLSVEAIGSWLGASQVFSFSLPEVQVDVRSSSWESSLSRIGSLLPQILPQMSQGDVAIATSGRAAQKIKELVPQEVPVLDADNIEGQFRQVFLLDSELQGRQLSHRQLLRIRSMATQKLVICWSSSLRASLKRLASLPLALESSLQIEDPILEKIWEGTVQTFQQALNWVTWTYLYRRLMANPGFYGINRLNSEEVSEWLSTKVEVAVNSLAELGLVEVDETLSPTTVALIGQYHVMPIKILTAFVSAYQRIDVESAMSLVAAQINLTWSSGERLFYRSLPRLPLNPNKALAVLHASLSKTFEQSCSQTLAEARRLSLALLDLSAARGHLSLTLTVVKLVQCLTSWQWFDESPLLMLPHFTKELVEKAEDLGISDLDSLSEAQDLHQALFSELTQDQVGEIAFAWNSIAPVEVQVNIVGDELRVAIQRSALRPILPLLELESETTILLLVDADNKIQGIQRTPGNEASFTVPGALRPLSLYVLSDCYLGQDDLVTIN